MKIHGYDDKAGHYLKRTNFSSLIMKQETIHNKIHPELEIESYSEPEPNKPQPLLQSGARTPRVTTLVQAQQSPARAAREQQSCQAVPELQRQRHGEEKLRIWASTFFL